MKKLAVLFIAIIILLSGCTASQSRTDATYTQITQEEAKVMMDKNDGHIIVDVRRQDEYDTGHIPDAVLIPNESIADKQPEELPNLDQIILVYCRSGRRSHEAALKAEKQGLKVWDMKGGILAYEKAGLPLQRTDTFTTPRGSSVIVTPIGHASVLLTAGDKHIYVDPVRAQRHHVDWAALPKADYIFITHEHYDHFDKAAISQLTKAGTQVILNRRCREMLGSGRALGNGDRLSLSEGLTVKAVPAYNTTAGREKYHPKGRDNGYVLSIDGLTLYFSGDTEPIDDMRKLGNIDVVFLPCNQPFTMTPAQLSEAAMAIRPKVLFPYHFSDTDITEIPRLLGGTGIDIRMRPYQ